MRTTDRAERVLRWLPTPTTLVVVAAGAVLVATVFAKGVRDADYWWHLTAGGLIAEQARVPNTDPFSFTWGGRPWTPHEWLSELFLFFLVEAGGETLALLVFGLIAAAVLAVSAWQLRRLGVRPVAVGITLALMVLVMAPYVTVRPQAISWLLMAVLVALFSTMRPERPWTALLLGPLFAVWANLHGLWVVGLGVAGVYLLFSIAGRTAMRSRWGWVAAGVGLALAGTMLTPAGPEGVLYPLRYVDAGDWGLENIEEWQSPDFHDPSHLGLLVLVLALVVTGGRSAPGWAVTLSWLGAASALVALRNAPVAAVLAAPALALSVDVLLPRRRAARAGAAPSSAVQLSRRLMEVTVTAVVVVAAIVLVVPQAQDPLREQGYPVEATGLLLEAAPNARVVGEYGWGGYLIHRLYGHGGRVFVDGRNDMYSETVLEEYSTIRDASPGWEEIVNRYRSDAILFPPAFTIAKVAGATDAWCEAYRDDVQVLLLRSCP